MKRLTRAPWIGLIATLTGCASSMSGVGGTDHYACKAPEGTLCTSVSGVYANSVHDPVRPDSMKPEAAPAVSATTPGPEAAFTLSRPHEGGIRSNARVLRVWVAPWEDSDGDLHEEAIVHVIVDSGRWLIDRVRPDWNNRMDAVRAPANRGDAAATTPDASQPNPQPSPSSPAVSGGTALPAGR